MSDDAWPEAAVDYVQAIADTKLVLGFRYAERMASGRSIEDDVANMNLAQEEFGHVRQLFELLAAQGRSREWLESDRDAAMYANCPTLDEPAADWPAFVVATGLTDRAAWELLDDVAAPQLDGVREKIAQEESFHLERADAWIEHLAAEQPGTVEAVLEEAVPQVLAFVGPATHDAGADPLYEAGFTAAPTTARRERLRSHLEALLAGTPASLSGVDFSAPDPEAWDAVRRREGSGSIAAETAALIQGAPNREFAVD